MNCRFCKTPLALTMIDLGSAPPSNRYLSVDDLSRPEPWYPLRVLVCEACWLVQTADFARREELFASDYAYFSGFSETWLSHVDAYAANMIERFDLTQESRVVEIAANDGSLLMAFSRRGIPTLGIEPTESTARAARDNGLTILEVFFGEEEGAAIARDHGRADLIAANNVLAHVPDINDFVAGFRRLLKPNGVATFEFPHLQNLLTETQFDTIYHEHFSYLSLGTVERILNKNGLRVFDVESIATHGGSLRVFAQPLDGEHPTTGTVLSVLESERAAGLFSGDAFRDFSRNAIRVKNAALRFLIEQSRVGKTVIAYGAAAKGNTFLNFAGIRPDLVSCVVDRNPAKQNRFLPGSRIPIVSEKAISEQRPDFIVILPWNLASEIENQLSYVRNWNGSFVTFIPDLRVF
ncbi:MAG: class I SAM-dependent methyltransferase [Pseudomonadota bacterium]